MKSRVLTLLLVLACCSTNTYALEDNSPEAMVADILVARPVCLAATAIGTVFFVVTLPFAALSKSVGKTADKLVKTPAKATFTRPVGDFSSLRD